MLQHIGKICRIGTYLHTGLCLYYGAKYAYKIYNGFKGVYDEVKYVEDLKGRLLETFQRELDRPPTTDEIKAILKALGVSESPTSRFSEVFDEFLNKVKLRYLK